MQSTEGNVCLHDVVRKLLLLPLVIITYAQVVKGLCAICGKTVTETNEAVIKQEKFVLEHPSIVGNVHAKI